MGTWGTAIFSDDTACDIRDEYLSHIGDGYSSAEATEMILAEWKESLLDPDEVSVIWLSPAVTQWSKGRLENNVKEKALSIISSGTDLNRWDTKSRRLRVKVLEKVQAKIESPQPKKKKIPIQFRSYCEWKVGELIAYKTLSVTNVLFRIIGHRQDKGGISPICELLTWQGNTIPGKFKLRLLGIKKKNTRTAQLFPNSVFAKLKKKNFL